MAQFTTRLNLYKPGGGLAGTNLPDEVADIDKLNGNFDLIDDGVGAKRVLSTGRPSSPFNGQIIKETDTKQPQISDGVGWELLVPGSDTGIIPAGTAAERDAFYGTPANAVARLALARNAARWFNTDTGYEEQYFALWADDTDKKFSAKAAGWYKNRARELPLPTENTNGASNDVIVLGAAWQLSTVVGSNNLFMRDNNIYGTIRLLKNAAMAHADIAMTFTAPYRMTSGKSSVVSGVQSGVTSASGIAATVDSNSASNPGSIKPLGPSGSNTTLEISLNFFLT